MNVAGIQWGDLARGECERLLEAARCAPFTYDHQGSTLDPALATAAGVQVRHLVVGTGSADFAAARAALRTWVPQQGVRARVEPTGQPVVVGATVLVVLPVGPCTVVAPNRVVAVVDEPRRFAFAYGTLPGHPMRGEESFGIEHQPDDRVLATIGVQAVGATPLVRAGEPAVRLCQGVVQRRYLAAIAAFVAAERTSRPVDGNEA